MDTTSGFKVIAQIFMNEERKRLTRELPVQAQPTGSMLVTLLIFRFSGFLNIQVMHL